jgi:hypothetical protein
MGEFSLGVAHCQNKNMYDILKVGSISVFRYQERAPVLCAPLKTVSYLLGTKWIRSRFCIQVEAANLGER